MLENFKTVFLNILSSFFVKWIEKVKSEPKANIVLIQEIATPKINYKNEISMRLSMVLTLMNKSPFRTFSIPQLADILNLSKVSELEKYFSGEEESSLAFLDEFAICFGINPFWLKFGDGSVFGTSIERHSYPMDYLRIIIDLNPEQIIFVTENSEERNTFIILKIKDWQFVVLPRSWHISSHIGGTGRLQLLSFYRLLLSLTHTHYSKLLGFLLESTKFKNLFAGNEFPGSIFPKGLSIGWINPFLDINPNDADSKLYEQLYGKEFLEAQTIIRNDLKVGGLSGYRKGNI